MVVAADISTATCVVVAIVAAATGAVCSHIHGALASSHDGACTMPSAHCQHTAGDSQYAAWQVKVTAAWRSNQAKQCLPASERARNVRTRHCVRLSHSLCKSNMKIEIDKIHPTLCFAEQVQYMPA